MKSLFSNCFLIMHQLVQIYTLCNAYMDIQEKEGG